MDSLLTAILELPVSDRLQLVQEIWDSIYACPELLPVTEPQKNELDRRLENHAQQPEGTSWNELRQRLLDR
ncbi:MAG: addiction module protein [Cyanobacteria bacterium P01_F01_bin.153]